MAESQKPARGYSWPPFEVGNVHAVKSGAFSRRLIEDEAQELVAEQLADESNTHLRAPRYRPQLLNWARLQVQIKRQLDYLDTLPIEQQMTAPRGGAKSLVESWSALVVRASGLADKLGLTPTSHARLARDMASASTLTALGARHPLRAALERISEERQAIEATVVERPATDELGVDDAD